MMFISRSSRLSSCAALAVLAGSVFGQPAGQPPSPPTAEPAPKAAPEASPAQPTAPTAAPKPAAQAPASDTLKRATADALIRASLFDLRVLNSANATDYALALLLLDNAWSLVPDDLELAHRRIEAAWGAGDEKALLAATEQVVRLDPKDSVAMLRLISSRLGKYQTTEERMARYDMFLGVKGESLDPAVRSRLALDSALLMRETGDQKNFIERLKLSMRLDPTNKDAALLAYNFYCERVNEPGGRLELLSNLLLADPLDPNLCLMIARELAGQGAYTQAKRFHVLAQKIYSAAGAPPDLALYGESIILDWLIEGPKKPVSFIKDNIELERNRAARARRELLGTNKEGAESRLSTIPKPEDVRLQSLEQEQVRAASAWIAGDDTVLANSIADMTATTEGRNELLMAANSRPPGMSEEAAAGEARRMLQDLCLWRLITGKDADRVEADLKKAIGDLADGDERKRAIEAWVALNAGNAQEAISICDRPGKPDDYTSLARAKALELLGRKDEAARAYDSVASGSPLTVVGAVAFEKAALCRGAPRKPGDLTTDQSRAAAQYAGKIPRWIDGLTDQPRLVQTFSVETGPQRLAPLERGVAKVRIKNLSSIPLAVGSDKPINTRFLFLPKIEMGATDRAGSGEPEVFDLGRRIRLLPGEEFEVEVWPEAGVLGWLAQNGSEVPTRLRWRVLQGFETRSGQKVPGAGCIEVSTPTQVRDALIESRLPPEDLIKRINEASDATLPAVLVASRVVLSAPTALNASGNGKADVAAALAAKYPTWSPTSRLLAALTLPPISQAPDLKAFDDAVKADLDKQVLLAAVITRTTELSDPVLKVAVELGDPSLARAAALQSERLRKDVPIYAKVGPEKLINAKKPTPGKVP